jgi:acetylornithine deacetylase/succinyl-diaminopimelate desuccinylase-like protein
VAINWDDVRDEVTGHLSALLRQDTTNPPGNETRAADYLNDVLTEAGIETTVVGISPSRGNVIARLRATNPSKRPLMLTGHIDVVSVEREKWAHDPFGGEVIDGEIWGRGALDMKSQVAAGLVAMLLLKREGIALDRDIIFTAFADEEAGGQEGAAWLWEHHRDLIDAEYAINEGGGGTPVELNGQLFYLCQAGEKGASRLRITARGEPGHASVPLDNTAMDKLGRALVKLTGWQPETTLTAPVRQMLETLAPAFGEDGPARVAEIVANPSWDAISALPLDDDTRMMLRATTRNTAVPTIVHGGHRINVIPSEIVLDVDGRILPGQDPDEWREIVQGVVGDEVHVELISRETGLAADPESPLFDAITETIAGMVAGAAVAPYLVSGGTDARNLPGIKVYGFFPFVPSDRAALYSSLVHGHNERIAVEDLAFATRYLYEVVTRFCVSA